MSSHKQKKQQRQQVPQQRITSIEPNDVLLGRGNHVNNPGNDKFRNLVRMRAGEYWTCNNNVTKDTIAREIIGAVVSLNGRFLRKATKQSKISTQSADTDSIMDRASSQTSEGWEVADMETILVKVKQTFRDFTASIKKKTISASISKSIQKDKTAQDSDTSRGINHPARTLPLSSITALPNTRSGRNLTEVSTLSNDVRDIMFRLSNESGSTSETFQNSVLFPHPSLSMPPNMRNSIDIDTGSASRNLVQERLHQLTREAQLNRIQSNLLRSQPNVNSALLELAARQRVISSLQRQRQQSSLHALLQHNLSQDSFDPTLSTRSIDQIDSGLLRQLLAAQNTGVAQQELMRLSNTNQTDIESTWTMNDLTPSQQSNTRLSNLQLASYGQRQFERNFDRNILPSTSLTSQLLEKKLENEIAAASLYRSTSRDKRICNVNDFNTINPHIRRELMQQYAAVASYPTTAAGGTASSGSSSDSDGKPSAS